MARQNTIGHCIQLTPQEDAALTEHRGREGWTRYIRRLIMADMHAAGKTFPNNIAAPGRPKERI